MLFGSDHLYPFYFGKYTLSGDFVSSQQHKVVLNSLDRWVAGALVDGQSIPNYAPIHFALVNPSKSVGILGSLVASQDSLARHYPFVTGVILEKLLNAEHVSHYIPLYGSAFWQQLYPLFNQVINTPQSNTLNVLATTELTTKPNLDQADFGRFLQATELDDWPVLYDLSLTDTSINVVDQLILQCMGLGFLMRPVLTQGIRSLSKTLVFDLGVADTKNPDVIPSLAYLVANFWLDLVFGFIKNLNPDILIMITRNDAQVKLLIRVNGFDSPVLEHLFKHEITHADLIHLSDTTWVKNMIDQDANLTKAYQHMAQTQVLEELQQIFKRLFLGTNPDAY